MVFFSAKKVSYEEFKLQFAQMYEHYERHRTDNITDPALRRAHPISTISGWDRDHDQTTDSSTKNGQALNDKAITLESEETQPEKSFKVSKSEQTDDDDVVGLENVECVCEENSSQDETNLSNDVDTTKEPTAQILNATESNKPVQSISSISQVYNEQLTGKPIVCNGDAEHVFGDDDDDTINTPTKQGNASGDGSNTTGSDALRKTLEIDSYDMSEDNKEIVDEIVEEILTKSENLLDDCKRSLDENHLEATETTSSPVIKDEEIEHAVSEVVKGVRNIERKAKRDSENDTDTQNTDTDTKINRENECIADDCETIVNTDADESSEVQNENQKTELVLSNAAIETAKEILGTDRRTESISENLTANASDGIKDIVATIVNDVIENCVNQTTTDNGDVCDNDMNKMSIIDNINNNSSDVATNDSNDNAIIVDTITQATDTAVTIAAETKPVEETNEEIIKGIVNEIVDKCVESEANTATDNDNNNNSNTNHNDEDSVLDKSGSETFIADVIDESSSTGEQQLNSSSIASAKFTSEPADNGNDNRTTKPNRSQGTSISTSTQVENNHFGNLA